MLASLQIPTLRFGIVPSPAVPALRDCARFAAHSRRGVTAKRVGKARRKRLLPTVLFVWPSLPKASFRKRKVIQKSPKLSFRAFPELCSGDSHGIQTHNLLIRSQVLYSVELGSQESMLFCVLCGCSYIFLFLDACLLSSEVAEVEDACSTNLTNLVDFD